MAGLVHYGKTGILTINGLVLNCPAWDIPDLTPLRANLAQTGRNALIAGVAGSRAKRRRYAEVEYQLPGFIIGHADKTGAVVSDALAGLLANQAELVTSLVDPVADAGADHVDASWVYGAMTLGAEVQCELVFGSVTGTPSWSKSRAPFVLRLTVPAGRFVAP